MTARFAISFSNNNLQLSNKTLNKLEYDYLEKYIKQINKYKRIEVYENSPYYSLYSPSPATNAGIRSLEYRLQRKFNNLRAPATATFALTKTCQCECEHCSAVYYNKDRTKKDLSLSNLKMAIGEAIDLGVTTIILLGGEPLLFKGIFELIQYIPKEQASVIMFTNGEFLTKENCLKLKTAGLLGAFISIDSDQEKIHDKLRKRDGLFSKALQGIQNMNEASLIPGISSYLTDERVFGDDFHKILELAKIAGAKEVTFFDAIPTGKWLKDESCLLTEKARNKIQELVREYRLKDDYPGTSVQSTMTSECGSAFCFAANTQFYLSAFGDMCPCDFTPLSFGKYPASSIKDLWYKMIETPPYNKRAKSCRMQDQEFRRKIIDKIPIDGPFPYPIENLN